MKNGSSGLVIGVGSMGTQFVRYLWRNHRGIEAVSLDVPRRIRLKRHEPHPNAYVLDLRLPDLFPQRYDAERTAKAVRWMRHEILGWMEPFRRVVVIVGGGGRTGGGAAPEVARLALDAGKEIDAVMTLPFSFENREAIARSQVLKTLESSTCVTTIANGEVLLPRTVKEGFEDAMTYIDGLVWQAASGGIDPEEPGVRVLTALPEFSI